VNAKLIQNNLVESGNYAITTAVWGHKRDRSMFFLEEIKDLPSDLSIAMRMPLSYILHSIPPLSIKRVGPFVT
jgi:hypothetical protein